MNIAILCDNYKLELFEKALTADGFIYTVLDNNYFGMPYAKQLQIECAPASVWRLNATLNRVETKIREN